ncbi:MAG: MFS transporter [Propionibacteriaceae bacterium]|nr:MFS transporter [Propionibacteriaceae bacterium]
MSTASRPFSLTAIAVLIVISGLAPLATATYLPAMPLAQAELLASPVAMQLTLTTFILGTALGQLVTGPISDRTGRKSALLAGLALYLISTVAVALSPTITWLIWWRVAQGAGAGAGMVLARAVVADRVHGTAAAKLMSLMMAVGVVAPAVAPLFGVMVLQLGSWRWIFGSVVVISLLVVLAVVFWLPETRQRGVGRTAGPGGREGRTWGPFLALTAANAFAFAAMYSLISGGPYLYQAQFGFSAESYAALNGVISLGMAAVTFFGTRAFGRSTRFGVLTPKRVALLSLSALLAGGLIVAAVHTLDAPVPVWLIALALVTLPVGLASGSLMALAMDASPLAPGSASAIIGVVQAVFGAAMPPLIGLGGEAPSGVIAVSLVVASGLALGMYLVGAAAPRERSR